MVKQTQTICPLLPTNCLSVFEDFVGLGLKGLTLIFSEIHSRYLKYAKIVYYRQKASEN